MEPRQSPRDINQNKLEKYDKHDKIKQFNEELNNDKGNLHIKPFSHKKSANPHHTQYGNQLQHNAQQHHGVHPQTGPAGDQPHHNKLHEYKE